MTALDTPITVRITASPKDMDKALASAIRRAEAAAGKIEKTLSSGASKGLSSMAQNAEKSIKGTTQAASNLSYQLNDISVSLAGGQSPFMIMMQQGSQVAQIFQQLKAEGSSSGDAISGAIEHILDPTALMSFAFIAAVGYAYEFFTAVEEGAKRSAEEIAKTRGEVQGIVKDMYSLDVRVKGRLNDVFDTAKLQNDVDSVKTMISDTRAALGEQLVSDEMGDAFKPMLRAFATMGELGQQETEKIRQGLIEVREAAANGGDVLGALTKQLADLDRLSTQYEGNKAVQDAIKAMRAGIISLSPGLAKLVELEKDLKVAQDALEASMRSLGGQVLSLKDVVGGLAGAWDSVTGKLVKLGETASKTFNQVQGDIKDASELIRKEENFIPKAKWDVNHFRVGYGSDTYVDEMGKVREVTKDTVITVEQAEADLQRRIGEFQAVILRQIGPEFWNSYSEKQKAALTSIAYNYGSLPASIVKAINTGDRGQVADAIYKLTANPARRKREAEMFGDERFTATEAKKSYDEWSASIKKKTEAQEHANTVNADTTSSVYQQIYAIEKQKAVVDGLAAAKEQGLTIDDALKAKIEEQADVLARAEANQRLLTDAKAADNKQSKESIKTTNELAAQYEQMTSTALSGFINDLRHGVDAGEAFAKVLDNIIGQLIEMAVQSMIVKPLFAGLSSVIPGLGAASAKSGGIVGFSGLAKSRVNPGMFAGARSMMAGGRVGDPNAVPIIAHRGEIVVPTSALRKSATQTRSDGQTNIDARSNVNVSVQNGGGTSTTTSSSVAFAQMIDRSVQGIIVRESRPGGLLRQRQGAR